MVIEVNLSESSMYVFEECWAGFLVCGVAMEDSGGVLLEVRYIGCEDGARDRELALRFQTGEGKLHLCVEAFCGGSLEPSSQTIHCREVRLWTPEKYVESPFLSQAQKAALEVWVAQLAEAALEIPVDPTPKRASKKPDTPDKIPPAKKAPANNRGKGRGNGEEKAPPARKRATPKEAAAKTVPAKRKSALKGASDPKTDADPNTKRAEDLAGKSRATVNKRPILIPDPGEKADGPEDAPSGVTEEFTEAMKKRLRDRLQAARPGGTLRRNNAEEAEDAEEESWEKVDGEEDLGIPFVPTTKKKHNLGEGSLLVPAVQEPLRANRESEKTPRALLDTRGSTMRGLKDPLVRQAITSASTSSKKKKKDKRSAISQLTKALTNLASGGKEKEKDDGNGKKKRKRKRRKRVMRGGAIESVSLSSSADESSEEEEASKGSDTDCEAPLRRKSQERPGSVLQMLTDHVRSALDQGATTSQPGDASSLTSGIRILTYFMLQVKPNYPTYLRELREMYHLAAVMDQLRQGQLLAAGDALAGRFIAIHQSMIDGSWSTARHMELHPMDEGLAANAAVVLATRRHSKLVLKTQGYNTWDTSYNKGKGRGGKQEWPSTSYKGDPKGG
eukprot:Skav215450  [mRNA]  locus=scaffold2193:102539:104389:- [translate_table: standard]